MSKSIEDFNIAYPNEITVFIQQNNNIENWIEKNHAFENELNLHEILDNPRYGNRLKLPVKSDKLGEKIVSIAYQFINDKLYLLLIEEMNEHCSIYAEYSFANPEHFENYVVNLESVVVGCYADSPKYYVNGEKAFLSTSVVYDAEPKELLQIMDSIMEIFIIIHNRPERTRIIKCSTTNESKPKERKEKSVNSSNNSNTDTGNTDAGERVLWRVLAPVKEAKDYIREANERIDSELQYAKDIQLLKKGYSLRNVQAITGTSIMTLRKIKAKFAV